LTEYTAKKPSTKRQQTEGLIYVAKSRLGSCSNWRPKARCKGTTQGEQAPVRRVLRSNNLQEIRAQSQCKSAAQGDRTPARRLLRSNNPQEIQETQTGAAYQGRGSPTKFEPKMVQPTRPHIPHPTPPAPHPTPPAPHTPPVPPRSEISPPAHTHKQASASCFAPTFQRDWTHEFATLTHQAATVIAAARATRFFV
jgi:hypothetical protein